MNPSRIEQAIDEIYNYVEECKPSKLYPSKVVVDREQLYDLLDELRLCAPEEIKRYQKIITNREGILNEAQQRAEDMLSQAQQQPAPENKKGDGHINGDLAHLGGHKLLGHDHIQQPAQAHEYNVLIGNVPHTAQTAERHHQHQETVHIREAEGQVVGEVEGVPNKIHRIIVKAEQEKQKQYNIYRLFPQRNAPVNEVQGYQQQRQHAAVDIGQHIVAAGANGGLQGRQVGC